MPYYKTANLLFIHIPKTGGTVIEGELKKQHKETLYSGSTNDILPSPFNKTSLQHQFYTTIFKFKDKLEINFENIKMFCVVRNPYDRIISDLFWYKLIKKNFNKKKVLDVIKNKYINNNDLDNHNVPQYKFIVDENETINPNIKIFHCEKLNDTNTEINEFIGFNINIFQKNVNKDYSKYLNNESIKIISDYYKKDFELFNYPLINIEDREESEEEDEEESEEEVESEEENKIK